MPGQYVVITRAPGTLITELVYNFDHQVHVDGRSAAEMGAYGISLSQYQLAEDPAPGGVESLPPSLAGEITRLRFVLAQIISELSGGASVNWYDAMTAPGYPIIGARIVQPTAITIPNNTLTTVTFSGGTTDFNTGSWANTPNPTRFTAPIAGKYLAFFTTRWNIQATGKRQIQPAINGSATSTNGVTSNVIDATAAIQFQSMTQLLSLNANDYVEWTAFQNSGSSIQLGAGTTAGGIVFLGT